MIQHQSEIQFTLMDMIETISKALCFEYYVGAKEHTDPSTINQQEALDFYHTHKEEYIHKATKLFKLISQQEKTLH